MARIIDTEYKNLIGDNVKRIRKERKLSPMMITKKDSFTYVEALFQGLKIRAEP